MATDAIHERLRRTRLARGEGLDSIARRTGLRPAWLRAMESARYEELPRGIYARSAIKSFAEALGMDPRAVIGGNRAAAAGARRSHRGPRTDEGHATLVGARRAVAGVRPTACHDRAADAESRPSGLR